MSMTRDYIKQEVLKRAGGRCERCKNPLGSRHYFHYKGYRILMPDTVWVVCSKCHSVLQSHKGKIY